MVIDAPLIALSSTPNSRDEYKPFSKNRTHGQRQSCRLQGLATQPGQLRLNAMKPLLCILYAQDFQKGLLGNKRPLSQHQATHQIKFATGELHNALIGGDESSGGAIDQAATAQLIR